MQCDKPEMGMDGSGMVLDGTELTAYNSGH